MASNTHWSYGENVVIRTIDGVEYEVIYAHMMPDSAIKWEKGTSISAGTVIGSVGSSGNTGGWPHLHFEMRKYSSYNYETVDPKQFFR